MIPSSPPSPMYLHAAIPSGDIAPIDTYATRQLSVTTVAREIKIALGMLRFGFLTSSPVWTMISYPSKAMKVRPIAANKPGMPIGIKSAKLVVGLGLLYIVQEPATIRQRTAPSCTIVTIVPVLPVSEVPLMFIYVNAAMEATAISLSNGMTPNNGWSDNMPATFGPSNW